MSKITCFHDGECPLCNLEINAMKKLDNAGQIQWVDITQDAGALANAGITYRQAMDKIHVLDENAQCHTGVRGFLLVWQRLTYYRVLAKIIRRMPFLLPVMEKVYGIFARYRLVLTGKKYLDESQ